METGASPARGTSGPPLTCQYIHLVIVAGRAGLQPPAPRRKATSDILLRKLAQLHRPSTQIRSACRQPLLGEDSLQQTDSLSSSSSSYPPGPPTKIKENILVPRPPNLSTRFQSPPGHREVLVRIACRKGAALAGEGAATQKGSPTPSNSLYAPRATPDAPRSASRAFSSP